MTPTGHSQVHQMRAIENDSRDPFFSKDCELCVTPPR